MNCHYETGSHGGDNGEPCCKHPDRNHSGDRIYSCNMSGCPLFKQKDELARLQKQVEELRRLAYYNIIQPGCHYRNPIESLCRHVKGKLPNGSRACYNFNEKTCPNMIKIFEE